MQSRSFLQPNYEKTNASPVKATFTSGLDKCRNIEETTKRSGDSARDFSISQFLSNSPRSPRGPANEPRTIEETSAKKKKRKKRKKEKKKKRREKEKGKDNDNGKGYIDM